ncbi:MAG: ABC transporter permease, partial [Phycisphaerae bacterium]
IFWTYGFPVIMILVLGLAFRNNPEEKIPFDLVESDQTAWVTASLDADRFDIKVIDADESEDRLRKNKTSLVVTVDANRKCQFAFDPDNPESKVVFAAVNDALQRAAGRQDVLEVSTEIKRARGSRYIDFLVPGLIGMNLMGGGLWGIGFQLVDMRVRKLLKRLMATPMKRADFLFSMVGLRMFFFVPEMGVLLLAAYLIFDIPVKGDLLTIVLVALTGSLAFAGIGLLTACRAKRIETISGLMNLVMLPMWLTSGIFFSSERFPDVVQPLIQALPLTQLNNALRAVILDGETLLTQWVPMLILVAWAVISFTLALRWFRWND